MSNSQFVGNCICTYVCAHRPRKKWDVTQLALPAVFFRNQSIRGNQLNSSLRAVGDLYRDVWLVVLTILKKYESQWEGLSMIIPYIRKIKVMFQTTNQIIFDSSTDRSDRSVLIECCMRTCNLLSDFLTLVGVVKHPSKMLV